MQFLKIGELVAMGKQSCIEQPGIIEEIAQGNAFVRFTQHSACGGCNAKMLCGVTESSEERVSVPIYNKDFSVGDRVNLQMIKSLGLKAVVIAYVVPVFIVLTTLLIFNATNISELYSGLISIGILVPYFIALSFYKNLLKKTFTFSISKLSS